MNQIMQSAERTISALEEFRRLVPSFDAMGRAATGVIFDTLLAFKAEEDYREERLASLDSTRRALAELAARRG